MSPAARALLCVFALSAASACESRRARIATAGLSLAAAGYATYDLATRDGNLPVPTIAVAITGGLFGVLTLLSVLDDEAERTPRTVTVRAPDRREEAWSLTKEAAAAARADDCERVKRINAVLYGVDRDFYNVVFARDAAILRCISTSTASDVPPSAPPVEEPAPSEKKRPTEKPAPMPTETLDPRRPF